LETKFGDVYLTFINSPIVFIYIQTKTFPSSVGVDIEIFLLCWTSGWKYCGLNVSVFSPWEQPCLKAQLMKELLLSFPPEDGNTNRTRKVVASNAWPQSKRRNKIFPVSYLILTKVLPSVAVLYFLTVMNPIINIFITIWYTVLLYFTCLRLQLTCCKPVLLDIGFLKNCSTLVQQRNRVQSSQIEFQLLWRYRDISVCFMRRTAPVCSSAETS
jgi:hypothetical protein